MKKTKQKFYQSLVLIILLISACAPSYVPNVVNTPLLSNKGEFQVTANAALSGFDPQLSYAVTDNIGLMVNGSFANQTSDSTDDYHKHQFVELGAGYYKKIGQRVRFEGYGGLGFGNLESNDDDALFIPFSSVKTTRVFLQPTIGATTEIFDGSFSSRFVVVNMKQDLHSDIGYFIEPVLTSRLGYKYVKVVTQFGVSIPLNSEIDFGYEPFIFSIGLQLNLGKLYDE